MGLLVAYILGLLTAVQKPAQRAEGGISPTTKSQQENEDSNNLSAFKPQVIPTPTNAKNSCQCCHHKTPLWKIVLEWLTFFAVLGTVAAATWYACITEKIWQEMTHQTKTAQAQLESTTRPWIGIADESIESDQQTAISPQPEPSNKIIEFGRISFRFKNYGKSPAIGVGYQFFFAPGGPKEHQFRDHPICNDAALSATRAIDTHAEGFKDGIIVFPDQSSTKQSYDAGTYPMERTQLGEWLVGCIAYIGEPRDRIYYTRLFYRINRKKISVTENRITDYHPIDSFEAFYTDSDCVMTDKKQPCHGN